MIYIIDRDWSLSAKKLDDKTLLHSLEEAMNTLTTLLEKNVLLERPVVEGAERWACYDWELCVLTREYLHEYLNRGNDCEKLWKDYLTLAKRFDNGFFVFTYPRFAKDKKIESDLRRLTIRYPEHYRTRHVS